MKPAAKGRFLGGVQAVLDLGMRGKRRKDLLFVVGNEIMFQCAWEIREILAGDPRLRFWFCPISSAFAGDWGRLRALHGLRSISFRWARRIKWDLILYPDHKNHFRPDCPKIYTGHGIEGGKLVKGTSYVFGERSKDANGAVIYEKILCPSEFLVEQVRAACPEFVPRLRVAGNLLADRLWSMKPDRPAELRLRNLDPERRTVFICSTWGPDSLIRSQGEALITEINRLSDRYNVILSIHLMNYTEPTPAGRPVRELLGGIRAGNVYLTKPGEEGGIFLLPLADILVTDATSTGLYFPHYERPIVYFDAPGLGFAPVGLMPELKKAAWLITSVRDLEAQLDACTAAFRPEVMRALAARIVSCPGEAAERHRREIYDSLKLDGLS